MSTNTVPASTAPTGGNPPNPLTGATGGTTGSNVATTTGSSTIPTKAALTNLANLRRFDVPKLELDASNYASWQHQVRRLLRLWKLWSVVEGTYARPTNPTDLEDWLLADEEAHA